MSDFSLNSSDPSKNSYYFPILIAIAAILLIIELFLMFIKEYKRDQKKGINISFDNELQSNMSYPSSEKYS